MARTILTLRLKRFVEEKGENLTDEQREVLEENPIYSTYNFEEVIKNGNIVRTVIEETNFGPTCTPLKTHIKLNNLNGNCMVSLNEEQVMKLGIEPYWYE